MRWNGETVAARVRAGVAGFRRLPKAARLVVAVAAVAPVFALAAVGVGLALSDDERPAGDVAATAPAAGGGSFLRGATGVLSHDLEDVLDDIRRSPVPADADGGDALDLDEALERLAEGVEAADTQGDLLDRLRDSEQGGQPALLMAHAMTLASAGDPWGAIANLLVAHEQDEDDASPLVNLAALANSQRLPAVALALLDAAAERDIGDEDSPVGMREQAALLNNRGHALVLLGRADEAEAPLREALALNPELSEAARNLVHVLLQDGREDEARALAPHAVWRLRRPAGQAVPTHSTEPGETPAQTPPPAGTPQDIAAWAASPWLEQEYGQVRLPLWIALDLSRQGQIAWPEVLFPVADDSYAGYGERASARFLAARERAAALRDAAAGPMQALVVKRFTLADTVHQAIHVLEPPLWMIEPIDTDMHPLDADKENLILSGSQATRFQALDVAQAEYQMEQAADRLYESYRRNAVCPAGSSTDECCGIHRREVEKNIADFIPYARDYEDQMRVFFRDAYGLSTAVAGNLPPGGWHDMTRLDIEQQVQNLHGHVQREIAFGFAHAAPPGGACYGRVAPAPGEAPEVVVDAPACSAASQWASGKWAFNENYSVEVTCGKIKFVAEVRVLGTKKLNWGPLNDVGAEIGLHAEIEFSMEGTVTVFAGPRATAAGKIGDFGADFGMKDGIYAVIGKDGVQDVGMRVVMGGGVAAGPMGGTHDVEVMDFSFVSAL